jgi:hypothetical protein
MAKCPKCGKEISHLEKVTNKRHTDKATYNPTTEDFEIETDYHEEQQIKEGGFGETLSSWYQCPECQKVLFRNTDKALNFIKS